VGNEEAAVHWRSLFRALILATSLPLVVCGLILVARVVGPTAKLPVPWDEVLFGTSVVSLLLGSWILYRAARPPTFVWFLAIAAYDTGMPIVIFGLIVLAEAVVK
jgi:hypothetical protein